MTHHHLRCVRGSWVRLFSIAMILGSAISFTPIPTTMSAILKSYPSSTIFQSGTGIKSFSPRELIDLEPTSGLCQGLPVDDAEMSSSSSRIQSLSSSYYDTIPSSSFPSTRPNDWKQLCPPAWKTQQTMDTSLTWNADIDDPSDVATKLFQGLLVDDEGNNISHDNNIKNYDHLIMTLSQSLIYFRDFCRHHLNIPNESVESLQLKARIVTTRGSRGAKCPQWHIDHVPVRWIQTMVGPGCEFIIGEKGVHRDILLTDYHDDTTDMVVVSVEERNKALVQSDIATILSAKEQEGLLLLGNQWPKYALPNSVDVRSFQPVLHKSPTIRWGRERVLLTQDVLLPSS